MLFAGVVNINNLPIISSLPFSASVAITYLINALLAFVAVVLVDRIISHEVEAKHALALSIVSFVAVPILAPFIGAFEKNALLVLSFVSWVILGEALLQSDWQTKLKVLVIAFVVYSVLTLFAADMVSDMLRRYMPV